MDVMPFGFIGNIIVSCSWGKIKSIQRIMDLGKETYIKGGTTSNVYGSLFNLGYPIPISKNISFIPYSECKYIVIQVGPYKEVHSPYISKIYSNKESLLEIGIGLCMNWEICKTSHLQLWMICNPSIHTIPSLTSISTKHFFDGYTIELSGSRKHFIKQEIGINYVLSLSTDCSLNFYGSFQDSSSTSSRKNNVVCSFRYIF